jgi:anaerobic ribonucleoside-triphosphate reductase activating protein
MNSQDQTAAGGLINMAAFLPKSSVNGPGLRAVVWVQGCPRRCPGCFNQDMQAFRDNQSVTAAELAARILAVQEITGVTFSGGEPFAQAPALAALAGELRRQGLNIVVFTGYTYRELMSGENDDWNRLLAVTDLLVAGPFERERPSTHYLLGSDNQELLFLTDRLRGHPAIADQGGQVLEITVDAGGNIVVTGLGGGLRIFGDTPPEA